MQLTIINFKNYKQSSLNNTIKLAKICERVAKKTKKQIMIGVQIPDIYRVSKAVKLPIIAQHIDPISYGRFTGFILPESIKFNGAYGTFLNHSEHHLPLNYLKECIQAAKRAKLKTFVFASSIKELKRITKFKPDFILIEPPELVAGNISVSTAKPSLIKDSVKATKIPVLCGAGIRSKEDIIKAYSLGAKGVAIASDFDLSKNPEKELLSLIKI